MSTTGIVFMPLADAPEPVILTADWSPFNRSVALKNLLTSQTI